MRRIFVSDRDHLDEPRFRALVLEEFPEVRPHVDGLEELTHVIAAGLENYANASIRDGRLHDLRRTYEFVAYLARHRAQVHPAVLNALHVSFLEGLQFDHPRHGNSAKAALPPVLRQMWEDQMAHNRKIGWMK